MPKRSNQAVPPQPGQPISLRTLGEYLNLSPATISLVLNNAPGVRSIPQDTRDRVTEAAAKFDYRPSFYARSLRKRQTFSVGVLVPELSDSYATQVLAGVEEFLIEEGYFYLTASHRRKPDLIEEYPRLLMERSVEGFIVIDTILEKSLSLPVVVVAGHRKIEGVTNVVLDQKRAAELALRHLYQLGHRKIAFMRGGSHSSDADDRWNCLTAIARDLKIPILPELCAQSELRASALAAHGRGTLLRRAPGRPLAVLHPAFALTGICHAMEGPLLPSLAPAFHLNDSQAGFLLLAYFAGTSLGALLCGRHHARTLTFGFVALAVVALAFAFTY